LILGGGDRAPARGPRFGLIVLNFEPKFLNFFVAVDRSPVYAKTAKKSKQATNKLVKILVSAFFQEKFLLFELVHHQNQV
jgi:hypothetical protein